MRRHALGIIAILFLLVAAGLTVQSLVQPLSPAAREFQAASLRVGTLLFIGWLAYDQILRVPRWAWFVFPALVIAVLLKQFKLVLLLIPIFLVIAILRPRGVKRPRRS